jgi:hypothetical protein
MGHSNPFGPVAKLPATHAGVCFLCLSINEILLNVIDQYSNLYLDRRYGRLMVQDPASIWANGYIQNKRAPTKISLPTSSHSSQILLSLLPLFFPKVDTQNKFDVEQFLFRTLLCDEHILGRANFGLSKKRSEISALESMDCVSRYDRTFFFLPMQHLYPRTHSFAAEISTQPVVLEQNARE